MAVGLGTDTAGQYDTIHAEPDGRAMSRPAHARRLHRRLARQRQAERFNDEGRDTLGIPFELVGYEI